MRLRDLVLDPWTPLSHKAPLSRPGGHYTEAPSWLPPADRRRLVAYTILKAYERNAARVFLPTDPLRVFEDDGSDVGRDERREYGEAGLLVRQTVAALLGDTQEVSVPGADADPDVPPAPDDPTPEDLEQLAEAEADAEQARNLADAEEWLRTWADQERLPAKLLESERNAVGLGDAVYLVAWDPAKRRPRLTVVDPGFYFPVLPEAGLADDYPTRVHLAWELPAVEGRPARVHRVTYELDLIRPVTVEEVGPLGRLRRVVPFLTSPDERPVLRDGDRLDADGFIVRDLPWHGEGDEPTRLTCYMTEAEWDLDGLRGGLDDLSPATATYSRNAAGELVDRLDLGFDFLPVLHVPNTPASLEHYGESSLSLVLQLLDELASSDTDESAASATTGSPPIGVSGAAVERGRMTMGPGEVWGLGADGRLSTVDTSANLTALGERIARLLERLSVNARLPGTVLGRGDAAGTTSGLHLLLTFGPLQTMVREMRLTRDEKYPLLLRFVQRLAMLGGVLPAGPVAPAVLRLGSFLPTDLDSEVKRATSLYEAGAISLPTLVRMLRDAGVPVENVRDEVEAIEGRDYARALQLADATNDQEAVRDLLGLPPAPPLVPALPLPVPGPPPVP